MYFSENTVEKRKKNPSGKKCLFSIRFLILELRGKGHKPSRAEYPSTRLGLIVLFFISFSPKHSVWQSSHLPNKEWASSPPLWHTEKLWAWQNQCYQRRWYHNWAPPISPGKLKHWLRKCRLPRALWVDRLNDKARALILPWRFVLFSKKIVN